MRKILCSLALLVSAVAFAQTAPVTGCKDPKENPVLRPQFGGAKMCNEDALTLENIFLKQNNAQMVYNNLMNQYKGQFATESQRVLSLNPELTVDGNGNFIRKAPLAANPPKPGAPHVAGEVDKAAQRPPLPPVAPHHAGITPSTPDTREPVKPVAP